ncbi:MAG: 4'-phosphopantetheinyl transferase superfamily protein [Rhodobacter sp.]|nr:4'-phosphopantetheinyl transferase superfamily protein [Rhodobacter sp.]
MTLDEVFPAAPAGFVTSLCRVWLGPGTTVLIDAAFDESQVSDPLFERFGVGRPDGFHRWVPRRRAEYLAGRIAAGAALASLGEALHDVPPDADRVPVWPGGIHGSISHSRRHAACVLSRGYPVIGVDIEDIVQGDSLSAILETAMTAPERGLITAEGRPDPRLATLVFSAKEAVYKALFPHVRTFFGFEALRLEQAPLAGTLRLRLQTTLSPEFAAGTIFEPDWRATSERVLTWLALAPDIGAGNAPA